MAKKKENKPKRKNPLKLGKITYGTMDKEECFRKAFEPYFNPDTEVYLERLG